MYIVFDYITSGILKYSHVFRVPQSFADIRFVNGAVLLGLQEGDTVSVEQLCTAAIVASANDAAVMLALIIAGTVEDFTILMNSYATRLELNNTIYADPSGLSNLNRSTLYEIMQLTQHLMSDYGAHYKKFSLKPSFVWKSRMYSSTNALLGNNHISGVYGIKTGYLEDAGFNFIVGVEREGIDMFFGLLGIKSTTYQEGIEKREIEARKLVKYFFETFSPVPTVTHTSQVYGSSVDTLVYAIHTDILIPNDWITKAQFFIEEDELWAPIRKGDLIGNYTMSYKQVPLIDGTIRYKQRNIDRSFFSTIIDRISHTFSPHSGKPKVVPLQQYE